jgi:hypothetical protein
MYTVGFELNGGRAQVIYRPSWLFKYPPHKKSFTWSHVTAQTGFSQLVKGAELMLHQNALLVARIHVTAPTQCLVSHVPLSLFGLSALLSALPQHTDIFRALVDRPLHYNYVITLYLLFCPVIIHEVEEQLAVMTERKSRKRKRIQHGGTMKYGTAAAQVAAEALQAP